MKVRPPGRSLEHWLLGQDHRCRHCAVGFRPEAGDRYTLLPGHFGRGAATLACPACGVPLFLVAPRRPDQPGAGPGAP